MSVIIFFCFILFDSSSLQHMVASVDTVEPQLALAECFATSKYLPADATLSDRAGQYRLTLVEVVDEASNRSALGTLTLRRQKHDLDSLFNVSTPLYGFSDIDLRSVGAYRVGDLESQDPQAPGVLVLESDRNCDRVITVRFGSEANRRDVVRYDGAYMVLRVHWIEQDGFGGSWRSGFRMSRASGYFCAVRTP